PVMAAVAAVVADRRPDRWGRLTFVLDADGAPEISGPGADAFWTAWSGDVALGAAASMLSKALPGSPGAPATLDATALGALTRRTERLLR
ncbi:MAG: hypothetical protein ABMB14_37945, partial [Myxococcota bacterium]